MSSVYYRVNRPTVISEVFEDEVVAVNLETGSYSGMSSTALDIWRCLEQGAAREAVVPYLASRYDADPAAIAVDVDRFLAELLEQDLIVEAETSEGIPELAASTNGRGAWRRPELSVYEDMQDLLQLDPIHDVDETGWPARKQETALPE